MAHFSAKKCITLGPNYQARTAQEAEDARERMENCIASFPSKTICCYKMRKACGSCVEPSPLKIFGLMFDAEAIHAQNPSNIQPNYHIARKIACIFVRLGKLCGTGRNIMLGGCRGLMPQPSLQLKQTHGF